jgi:putative Mg2+ transporter-C (MgtC) family protein
MISHYEMILRILVGAFLGGAIGFERDRHRRQAGLRDHFLVGLASATFMVVSAQFHFFQHYNGAQGVGTDPSRIAASVVTGIGFLAGGAILKTGITVQGLTTAAGLWMVAAIGLCSGAGMFWEAGTVTVMGLTALTLFRIFQEKSNDLPRRQVTVTVGDPQVVIPELYTRLVKAGVSVSEFDYEQSIETNSARVCFETDIPIKLGLPAFMHMLARLPGVLAVKVNKL